MATTNDAIAAMRALANGAAPITPRECGYGNAKAIVPTRDNRAFNALVRMASTGEPRGANEIAVRMYALGVELRGQCSTPTIARLDIDYERDHGNKARDAKAAARGTMHLLRDGRCIGGHTSRSAGDSCDFALPKSHKGNRDGWLCDGEYELPAVLASDASVVKSARERVRECIVALVERGFAIERIAATRSVQQAASFGLVTADEMRTLAGNKPTGKATSKRTRKAKATA